MATEQRDNKMDPKTVRILTWILGGLMVVALVLLVGIKYSHSPSIEAAAIQQITKTPAGGENPMAELQRLMDEDKAKSASRVFIETYWPFAAGVMVFLGLVIVVVKLVRRKKVDNDEEEGILDIEDDKDEGEKVEVREAPTTVTDKLIGTVKDDETTEDEIRTIATSCGYGQILVDFEGTIEAVRDRVLSVMRAQRINDLHHDLFMAEQVRGPHKMRIAVTCTAVPLILIIALMYFTRPSAQEKIQQATQAKITATGERQKSPGGIQQTVRKHRLADRTSR